MTEDAAVKRKQLTAYKLSSWMYMLAGALFLLVPLVGKGDKPRGTFVALGAVFIALGGGAARRAKTLAAELDTTKS